ncbi:unnamed protein product [Caretta caretta]
MPSWKGIFLSMSQARSWWLHRPRSEAGACRALERRPPAAAGGEALKSQFYPTRVKCSVWRNPEEFDEKSGTPLGIQTGGKGTQDELDSQGLDSGRILPHDRGIRQQGAKR